MFCPQPVTARRRLERQSADLPVWAAARSYGLPEPAIHLLRVCVFAARIHLQRSRTRERFHPSHGAVANFQEAGEVPSLRLSQFPR